MAQNTVAGMNYPTQKALLAGNPRDSAIQSATNANVKLANLSKIGGKKRGGASSQGIPVPQYQMLYSPQGGDNTHPNSQIQNTSRIGTQGAANSIYDSLAMKKGGKKSRKNSKKHNKKSSRKSRKGRKTRKHH